MPPESTADFLDQLFEDLVRRRRAGEQRSAADYAREHPQLAEQIHQLFPALVLLEDAGLDMAVEPTAAPPPPMLLGDYLILHEIGRGGMGVVYLAEQQSLRRRVALKVLPAHLTLTREAVARFRVEASSAARLRHPGIVHVHAVGEQDGHHFFAMELVQGAGLDEVITELRNAGGGLGNGAALPAALARVAQRHLQRDGKLLDTGSGRLERTHERAVCVLVVQIAEALQHAHDAGVIHRDVKPSNVLLRPDGTAVLTDFGLARDDLLPGNSQSGTFAGTPHYASPEQVRAVRSAIDCRTDVFSLGVTLYELLTLQRPFTGDSARVVLERIVSDEVVDPRRLQPRLPRDLAVITLKALAKAPERRYPSAAALAADLRAFLAERPIQARPATLSTRACKFASRHRAACTAAAAVFAVTAVFATWQLTRPASLTLASVDPGVVWFVDGDRAPAGAITRAPGTHIIHLVDETRELLSRLVEVEVTRGPNRVLPPPLFTLRQVVESVRDGESEFADWPDHPALRQAVATVLRSDREAVDHEVAVARFDGAARLVERMARLDPDGADQRAASAHLAAARQRAQQLAVVERQLTAAIAAAKLSTLPGVWRRIAQLGAVAGEFQPAIDTHERLRRSAAARVVILATAAPDADLVGLAAAARLLDDVDPGQPALSALTARLQDLQLTQELILHRTAAERQQQQGDLDGLAATMNAMVGLGRDHAETQAVIAMHNQLLTAQVQEQQASEAAGRISGNALAPFRDGSTAQLAAQLQVAETLHLDGKDSVAVQDLRAALTFLRSCEAVRAEAMTAPEAARELRAELDPELHGGYAPVAREVLLPRLDRELWCYDQLREAARSCDCRQVEDATATLAKLGTEVPAGLGSAIAELRARCRQLRREAGEFVELEQRYVRFCSQLAALQLQDAATSLAVLELGWRQQLELLGQAIACGAAPELQLQRAELYLRVGDFAAAAAAAAEVDGRQSSSRSHLLLGMADYLSARAAGDRSEPGYRAALAHFDRALELDASDPRARYWRGACRHELGDADLALADFEAVQHQGAATADLCYQIATIHYADGLRAHEAGNQAAAHDRIGRAADALGDALRLPFGADDVLVALGGAVPATRTNATRFRWETHTLRADAHLFREDFALAIDDLNQALILDPNDPKGYYLRGFAQYWRRNYAGAVRDLEQTIRLVGKYSDVGKPAEELRLLAAAQVGHQ